MTYKPRCLDASQGGAVEISRLRDDLCAFNLHAMGFRIVPLVLCLFLLQLSSLAQGDRLDAAAFQARMKEKGVQLVDVRTPEEFSKGHIKGAILNDWLEDGFLERAAKLDRSKPVLLYCAAGGRSEDALGALKQAGFTDVVDLREGFNGWKRSGLPVSTE